MKNKKIAYLLFSVLFFFCSFNAWKYGPYYFPKTQLKISTALNEKKVELGRMLFYDPIFSKDSSISCASCHSPFNAFAHTDHDLSHGINDSIGIRNAPALFNLAWQPSFMWDGAVNHLEVQALAPIEHPGEMNETIKNISHKLQRQEKYRQAFKANYGQEKITGKNILKSLAEFQLSLVSANAKYDSVIRGQCHFTVQEKKGSLLFQSKCASCHIPPLFSSFEFANNGLAVDSTLNDYGQWSVTKKSSDSLKFKIPSLRNLSYTFPYMHDGRFDKLREVLNHYDKGIVHSKTLSPRLKNNIKLTSNQKTDLIAFLLTLNDRDFVFSKKHSFPQFVEK